MRATISINDAEKIGRNLWRINNKYYRLFAKGVTPNSCWLIAPELHELKDIHIPTGTDIYGTDVLEFDGIVGTVPAHHDFVRC